MTATSVHLVAKSASSVDPQMRIEHNGNLAQQMTRSQVNKLAAGWDKGARSQTPSTLLNSFHRAHTEFPCSSNL